MSLHSNYPKGFADGINVRGLPVLNTYNGRVFWVYNGTNLLVGQRGGSNGNKGTFDAPFSTLDFAMSKCTGNRDDLIMVKAGHSETLIADSGVNMDVAGVHVIGLGTGSDRPTFDFTTDVAADFKLNAANVGIHNLLFTAGQNIQTMCIEVSGVDAEISHCEFRSLGGTNEFLIPISIGVASNDSDRCWIHDCIFISDTAAATSAIAFAQLHADVKIEDCTIRGDWSDAAIQSAVIQTDCIIRNNLIRNDNAGEHGIQFSTTATGVIQDNTILNDVYSLAIDPGSCDMAGNRWLDPAVDTGDIPFPALGLDSVTAGALPQAAFAGLRFFVDSGHSDASDTAGYGTSPSSPFATADFGIEQCTANNGDVVYVMAGHAENLEADSALDFDIAGVTMIGLGQGNSRPTFTFDGTDLNADAKLAAVGCSMHNLLFIFADPGNDQVMGVEVSFDDCEISHCEFRDNGTNQPLNMVTIGTGDGTADRFYIHHCKFHGTGAGTAVSAIDVVGDHTSIRIEDNQIYGDYDNAGIDFDATANASLDANVLRNVVTNKLTSLRAIDLGASGSTGVCADNRIFTDKPELAIRTGGLAALNNIWSDGTSSSFDLSSGGGGGLVCVKSKLNIGATEIDAFTVTGGPILVTGLIFQVTETAVEGATFIFDDMAIEGGGTSIFNDITQELNIDDVFAVGDYITCEPIAGAVRVALDADIDAHGFSRVLEAGTIVSDGAATTDFEVNAMLFYHSLGGTVVAIA